MGCGQSKAVVDAVAIPKSNYDESSTKQAVKASASAASMLSKYHRDKILGTGAFGEVFIGTHIETGLSRAIKIIAKNHKKPSSIDDVRREIQVLQKLSHPNIVRLIEHFEDDAKFYLIFEHYSGGEVFERLTKSKKYSERDAATIMYQLMSAVALCHQQNIVHADLKPENLVYEDTTPYSAIRVIDFGTSMEKRGSDGKLTEVIGTPYYMAPEVWDCSYDEKCDIWSAGVIAYTLLTGEYPFNVPADFSGTEEQKNIIIRDLIRANKPDYSGANWKLISKQGLEFVQLLLTAQPTQRPSATDVLAHPWMKRARKLGSVDDEEIEAGLLNLKGFTKADALERAIIAFMSQRMTTREENEQMTRVFQSLDANSDGRLTFDELREGYERIFGSKMKENELRAIFEAIDLDKSGYVDYSEFIAAAVDRSILSDTKRMSASFKDLDADGSGKISVDELKSVFQNKLLTGDEWHSLVKNLDVDGDGQIDWSEFSNALLRFLDQDKEAKEAPPWN